MNSKHLVGRALVDPAHGQALGKALANGDVTPEEIRSIPAQSLYMGMQAVGIESCLDVLLYVTNHQYQVLLDLEFWHRDEFRAEEFFDWLELIDSENTLEPFERFLRSCDIELFALIVARYVETVFVEESTDQPPGPAFYTPDRGHTWIQLKLEDPDQHRVFAKFLAYVFQRDAKIFYQLISAASVGTSVEIEEGCFQSKERRLESEGIPNHERAWEKNKPLSEAAIQQLLAELPAAGSVAIVNTEPETTLPANRRNRLEPLSSLFDELEQVADAQLVETVEAEFASILNSALVFYQVTLSDSAEVSSMQRKVRGALNIGLARARELSGASLREIVAACDFSGLYQFGLFQLNSLRTISQRIPPDLLDPSSPGSLVVQGCAQLFPVRIQGLDYESITWEESKTPGSTGEISFVPFEQLADVRAAEALLTLVRANQN